MKTTKPKEEIKKIIDFIELGSLVYILIYIEINLKKETQTF